METVETKNSKLWLVLAIVFGVLIPLPIFWPLVFQYKIISAPLGYFIIVSQLYSWIILPRVKKWYLFAYFVPMGISLAIFLPSILLSIFGSLQSFESFINSLLSTLCSPEIIFIIIAFNLYYLWNTFWFFFPCIRLINQRRLKLFLSLSCVLLFVIYVLPLLVMFLGIPDYDFAAGGKTTWDWDPQNWNWTVLWPIFNV